MTDNKDPEGIIWAPDIHHVYLGGKPTKVFAPQYGMINTYNAFQKEIQQNGGIPLGIDHLPETVLESNPILKETLKASNFDPYNVGEIRAIALENDRIKITDSEITNPTIQKLYNEGKLPAFSMVGKPVISQCPNGKADVIVDDFSQIKRVDFVMAGGCSECKTNADMLTAKLSSEEQIMTEEEMNQNETQTEEASNESNESQEEEQTEENEEEQTENNMINGLVESVNSLKETVSGIVSGEIKIEAKLPEDVQNKLDKIDDIVMEATTSKVETKINKKIMDGTVTPAMKEGLLEAGKAMPEESFNKMLDGLKTKLWEGGKLSETNLEANNSSEEDYKYEDYEEACKKAGIKP